MRKKCFHHNDDFLYWIFIIVGIFFLIIARIPYGYSWCEGILDGLGCSCVSAAFMAICIEKNHEKRDREKKDRIARLCLWDCYNCMVEMLQRVLWFNERWDDSDFNWDLSPEEYGSLKYMIFASNYSLPNKNLDLNEFKKQINGCAETFSYENINKMSEDELIKLHKMLNIILCNSMNVVEECKRINSEKLTMSELSGIELEFLEDICKNTSLAFNILCAQGRKNYGICFRQILNCVENIRNICCFDNEFEIALQGPIRPGEL